MTTERPLVTIGIPTYNRSGTLGRAIESALRQDHAPIEVIVSDNASTDETEAVCRGYADQDGRVKYLRSAVNVGPMANFRKVVDSAHGRYFLWLADDDWLDANYLSACVEVLEERPDLAVAYGRATYYGGDQALFDEPGFSLLQRRGASRVVAYFLRVRDNAAFYGVMRRSAIDAVPPLRSALAADWLFVASLAFGGKVQVIPDLQIHRSRDGISVNFERIAEMLGLSRRHARWPYLSIAMDVFREIAWRSPAYKPLGRRGRLVLALRCQPSLWFRQAATSAGSLGRHAATRPLHALLVQVYRTLPMGRARAGSAPGQLGP
jgi:glycosyltransferase involved in cell wall biosynthesis